MFLYEVTTAKEIEQEYGLPEGSVRRDISRNKFRKSEIRKSGSTWLIAKREAKRVYKGELTMINVRDDWGWVSAHVDEELQNEILFEEVQAWANKKGISIERVKELYHDGLSEGIEEGKYLPFSQWFYGYKEFDEEWEGYDDWKGDIE